MLEKIQEAGVTLNPDKCEFQKTNIKFLGHIIDQNGVHPHPDKMAAVSKMPLSTTVTELRCFLGMVNQLGKITPHLAQLTKPLRDLLSKTNDWHWEPDQEHAFAAVKSELTTAVTLAHYNPDAATKVCMDASSCGLGCSATSEGESWGTGGQLHMCHAHCLMLRPILCSD